MKWWNKKKGKHNNWYKVTDSNTDRQPRSTMPSAYGHFMKLQPHQISIKKVWLQRQPSPYRFYYSHYSRCWHFENAGDAMWFALMQDTIQ